MFTKPPTTTVLLMPLDDRPVNTDDPIWMGKLVGARVLLPPKSLLGRAKQPGKPDALLTWLANHIQRADAAVISTDMIAYGGLIASRDPATPYAKAQARLTHLANILRTHPQIPTYLWSVLLRLSISVWHADDQAVWEKLFQYASLGGKQRKQALPPKLLQHYLGTRRRNHNIQKRLTHEVRSLPHVKKLIFCQEDAAPRGMHQKEQKVLRQSVSKLGRSRSTHFFYGADEVGMMLVSRALLDQAMPGSKTPHGSSKEKVALRCLYHPPACQNRIPRYEGDPLWRNIQAHAKVWSSWWRLPTSAPPLRGRQPASPPHPTQNIVHLLIHGPATREQEDLFLCETPPTTSVQYTPLIHRLERVALKQRAIRKPSPGKAHTSTVLVADLRYANGGDPHLFQVLAKKKLLGHVTAYAGWNTVGNSIGTVLAVGALTLHPHFQQPVAKEYLFRRYLEDIGYQALTRPALNGHLKQQRKNLFALGPATHQAERTLQSTLIPFYHTLSTHFSKTTASPKKNHLPRFTLPWQRTFEIRIS